MDIDVEECINSLSDEEVREILIEAAKLHLDVLEMVKDVGMSRSF
jgi:hypothetical protein